MRILFMGTPEFAVASLRRLAEDGYEICGVFTQPDKPKNRGMKLTFSPVKEYALTRGFSVFQPLKMRDGTALELVRELAPELIVVAAYGKILPQEILDVPKYGSINVHSSLLPRYRGAAPINWAILNGETETGVSIMPVVQTEILDNAARYVRHGGALIYSTCTLLPEENGEITDAFLAGHPEFAREAFLLPPPVGTVEEGQITLWPQRNGVDGFYICRMRRA